MQRIIVAPDIPKPLTELFIGKKLLQGELLSNLCKKIGGKIAIAFDPALKALLDPFCALDALFIPVLMGEKAKSEKGKKILEKALFQNNFGRESLLIAFGGGAICDLAGFAASTFLRGIPHILIPTTLLAMVDASIGGKTAINTEFGKNLIGTFYHPKAVVVDWDLLSALPKKEIQCGLAEILKIGLVFDPSIWDRFDNLEEMAKKAILGKISVIEKDPMETGFRRILNFGHTIGHGLEKLSNFKMAHGMAVALGSLAESYLSMSLGFLSSAEFTKIFAAYKNFPLKLSPNYSRKKLVEAMRHDKKKSGEKLRFVLIDRIGHAVSFNDQYCRPVAEDELKATFQWMEDHYGNN